MKKLFAIAIVQLILFSATQAQDSKKNVPPPPPPPRVEKVQFTTPPPPPPVDPAMKKKPAKRTIRFAPPAIRKDSIIK